MKIAAGTVFFGFSVFLHSIELSSQGGVISNGLQCCMGRAPNARIPGVHNRHLSKEHLPFSESSHISIMLQGARYILSGRISIDPTYGAWVYDWWNEPMVTPFVERVSVYSPKEGMHFKADLHRIQNDPDVVNTEESHCYVRQRENTYHASLHNDRDAVSNRQGFTIVRIVALNPHSEDQRLSWVGILQRLPKTISVPEWVQHPQ